jgi:hypothetical protein
MPAIRTCRELAVQPARLAGGRVCVVGLGDGRLGHLLQPEGWSNQDGG